MVSSASRCARVEGVWCLGGVVGARGDLHACFAQHGADRLDPECAALHDPVAVSRRCSPRSPRPAPDGPRPGRLLDLAVELRRGEKRCGRAQDLVRAAELADLPLQLADPRGVVGGDARPQTTIDLGLADPGPQRLRMDPELVSDPLDRPRAVAGSRRASNAIRVALSLNSSLYFFGAATTLILPGMKASTRPGAIQRAGQHFVWMAVSRQRATGYRIGRYVRYRRAAVEAWLETQTDHQHVVRGQAGSAR